MKIIEETFIMAIVNHESTFYQDTSCITKHSAVRAYCGYPAMVNVMQRVQHSCI